MAKYKVGDIFQHQNKRLVIKQLLGDGRYYILQIQIGVKNKYLIRTELFLDAIKKVT